MRSPARVHLFARPAARFAVLLSTLMIGALGCDAVENLDNFEVPITAEAVIDAATPLEVLLNGFPQLDAFTRMDLTDSAAFRNGGYDAGDVDRVTLVSMVMVHTAPDVEGADLSFFGEVRFYIEAEDLPRLEIARAESFPEGARSVAFDTVDDDLRFYLLSASGGTITAEIDDTRRPDVQTTIELRAVFDVDVNVL